MTIVCVVVTCVVVAGLGVCVWLECGFGSAGRHGWLEEGSSFVIQFPF